MSALRLFGPLFALCLGLCALRAGPAAAQPLYLDARTTAVAPTTDRLPLWMTANRYGQFDARSTNMLVSLAAHHPVRSARPVDAGVGAEVVGRLSERSTLHMHQLYGTLKTGPIRFRAGWRHHMSGMVDSTLSMGSTMWSRNAPPMPKISLSMPEYVAVPGTRGFVAVRGYVAHGWFEPGRYIDRPYLHEKYAYLRLHPPGWPVQGHAGFIHNVVWAGTHPTRGDLPDGFNNFLRVLTGQGAASDSGAPRGEQTNVLGNTVGAYDFALTVAVRGIRGRASRQFYVEDTVGMAFRNVWDGLWSLSLRRARPGHLVDAVLYEHLRTTRQGARFDLGEPRGADSYYNNFVYRSGWTYRGRTLGTPLLTAGERVPGVVNNIVIAHHAGVAGTLRSRLRYRALLTYSRNYGATNVCQNATCTARGDARTARRDRYAMHLTARGALPGWPDGLSAHASLSADLGLFATDRFGLALGLRWRGPITP